MNKPTVSQGYLEALEAAKPKPKKKAAAKKAAPKKATKK